FKGDFAENTAQLLKRMNEISQFAKAAGKPVFLAHPFRIAVNYRLLEREIGPEVTAIQTRKALKTSAAESWTSFSCLTSRKSRKLHKSSRSLWRLTATPNSEFVRQTCLAFCRCC